VNTAFAYRLYSHVVDTSGAADQLTAALRESPRGRPPSCTARTFLILLLLAAADGEITIRRMHRIATRELPRDIQLELGTVRPTPNGAVDMPINELYYLTRTITKKLTYSGRTGHVLKPAERQRRHQALQDIVDRLVTATLPTRPGTSYALDESAIWAWAKGRKRTRQATDGPTAGQADTAAAGESPSACPDARWGTKTGKNGEQHAYFGYALHALVRVPDLKPGPSFSDEDDPILIEAITLTPASTDVVDVSLAMLDRVRSRQDVKDLIADRHYSYKDYSRWARQLWARGVHPVLDLRADEHGFRDYNSTRIAAGWPHCPATPDTLAKLPRPGSTAAQADKDAFLEVIRTRHAYAMRRVAGHVPDGRTRWECPARAGKIGCPIVEGSVPAARQLDLPVINTPPAQAERHACCTQRTFMIRIQEPDDAGTPEQRQADQQLAVAMKLAQDEYWGDHRWQTSWNRRTYIEGAFGNHKNPNPERLGRGLFRFTGLPLVSLAVAASVTAANTRQLRAWHERTGNGDPTNPLLAEEPTFHGYLLLAAPRAADEAGGLPTAA
jgi:hypothetical protein